MISFSRDMIALTFLLNYGNPLFYQITVWMVLIEMNKKGKLNVVLLMLVYVLRNG